MKLVAVGLAKALVGFSIYPLAKANGNKINTICLFIAVPFMGRITTNKIGFSQTNGYATHQRIIIHKL